MRLHRFYMPDTELGQGVWLRDAKLLHQWSNVLRFRAGQEVVLFDGKQHDRQYRITELQKREAHLELVADLEYKRPDRSVYLMWSLLKKDKNDWVLQKATELGVSHFLPLLAERSEKTGFNIERAERIVIEAAEQCGRSDIPIVREPMRIPAAIEQLQDKVTVYVCEQSGQMETEKWKMKNDAIGVLIGPEGGWSGQELEVFDNFHLPKLQIHDFTLRAETAAIVATALIQTSRIAADTIEV